MKCFFISGIWLWTLPLKAAVYYVATTGNNGNAGTQLSPWLTIAKAASTMIAGDTTRVQPGTYDENPTLTVSGSVGSLITYLADGPATCRGFDLTDVSYIRIVGFEITHVDTTYDDGIIMAGTCSHIDLIDNYIHNIRATHAAISCSSGTSPVPSYITIRGNRIDSVGIIPGVATNSQTVAISTAFVTPHHWLIEYNLISKAGDFVNAFGTNIIVRNNYLHDYADAYWTNAPNAWHSDMFQPGSDGVEVGTRHQVYERNFCGDSLELNSHFGIWQDTVIAGDTNIMIRGNVGFNFGSGGIGVISTDHVSVYNNTFYKITQAVDGAVVIFYKGGSGSTDFSLGNLLANTIIYDSGLSSDTISLPVGNTATLENNLGYLAGSESSYVSTSDPLFIDITGRNFRLQGSSPAISAGTNIATVTSANGSGTTFNVSDGQLFIDGWGMVDGDTVTVGGTTTRITSIGTNSVTVSDSVTWTNGMPVYWGTDTTPEIGAFPYGSNELTSAVLRQSGTTYTVVPTGDARGVWFYVDGIPTTWDSTAPFTATISSGVVTAKAYALYAQNTPVVYASLGVNMDIHGKADRRGKTGP